MKDLLRKGLLVGLGVAEFTRETLSTAVAELQKKGEVSEAEAKKIMESFARTARQRRKEFEGAVESGLSSLLGRMRLATADRIEELEKRLKTLERKLKAKK